MIDAPWLFGAGFAAVYGLVIGSFLAVCIVRLPEDRTLLAPSACPRCGARVRWRDNVPVIGWLALRGRCRDCGGPISPLHPLVEALGGVLALLLWVRVVPDGAAVDLAHCAAWAVKLAFSSALVVAAAVDVRHRIIPDEVSVYAVPFGIAAAVGLEGLGADGWLVVPWRSAVLGAAVWGSAFGTLSLGGEFVAGQPVLGWGDVKLAAMLGAFLGLFPGAFGTVLFGSLFGAAFGLAATLLARRRLYLPFGPPLAVAGILWAVWGDVLAATFFPGASQLLGG